MYNIHNSHYKHNIPYKVYWAYNVYSILIAHNINNTQNNYDRSKRDVPHKVYNMHSTYNDQHKFYWMKRGDTIRCKTFITPIARLTLSTMMMRNRGGLITLMT